MPASGQRSGNPAKQPTDRKPAKKTAPKRVVTEPTAVSDWKRGKEGELLELPTGKVARIQRIPLPSLIAENLLGDSISVLAQQAVDKGMGMDPKQIQDMGNDPKKIMEALDAFDKIAARCFLEPAVLYYKYATAEEAQKDGAVVGAVIPDGNRDSEALYSDEIDLQDKIYLFQVVSGGTTDLQTFRKQFQESMAGLSDSA